MDRDSYLASRPPSLISSSSASSNSLTSSLSSLHPIPIPFPTSTQKDPIILPLNPRHALMRSRRVSLPANIVQTNLHSLVTQGSQDTNLQGKRMSVTSLASVSSFDSLPEEIEEEIESFAVGGGGRVRGANSIPSLSVPKPPAVHRHSLPPGGGLGRAASPLGRVLSQGVVVDVVKTREERVEEKRKREERRWKIATELRDTERRYFKVLRIIDEEFYQPLLLASSSQSLTKSDLAMRRAKSSTSSTESTSTSNPPQLPGLGLLPSFLFPSKAPSDLPPVSFPPPSTPMTRSTSTTTPPPPPPTLPRQSLTEIFSNFPDVLRLSTVLLQLLEAEIPDPLPSSLPTPIPNSLNVPDLSFSSSSSSSSSSEYSSSPGILAASFSKELIRTASGKKGRGSGETARPVGLGKGLVPVLPFLKCYGFFVSGFSGSLGRLGICEADESFKRWLEGVEGRVGGGLGLRAMLLSVVQRVPRYRLVLGDLVRFTEKDHPDRRELKKAWGVVDDVARHLESQIVLHTNTLTILDLQKRFTFLSEPLLAPGRRLIKLGNVKKLDRRGNEQERTLLLFNDLFVVASPEGEGWRFHRRIGLEDVTVVGEDGKGLLVLGPEKSFAVIAETSQEKVAWIDIIRQTKSELMSDRRTLQLDSSHDPTPISSPDHLHLTKRDRRISLPVSSAPPRSNVLLRTPTLDFIPGTPSTEIDEEVISGGRERESTGDSSQPDPEEEDDTSSGLMSPNKWIEYRVMENYSAPVWVPDSKADRCMKCTEGFGVWRRRHHCRLCGAVVCWACSTKSFIIPSHDPQTPDRLARSCDACYQTVFGTSDAPSFTHDWADPSTVLSAHVDEGSLEGLEQSQREGGGEEGDLFLGRKVSTPASEQLASILGR